MGLSLASELLHKCGVLCRNEPCFRAVTQIHNNDDPEIVILHHGQFLKMKQTLFSFQQIIILVLNISNVLMSLQYVFKKALVSLLSKCPLEMFDLKTLGKKIRVWLTAVTAVQP